MTNKQKLQLPYAPDVLTQRRLASRICFVLALVAGMINGTRVEAQQFCPMGLALLQQTSDYDLTKNGGATVTHTKTGLTWMRCSVGQTWNGTTCQGAPTNHNWAAALVNAKNENSFSGGWRVPNINELRSIIETGCDSPAINETVFPVTNQNDYWSASTYAGNPTSAWYVNFALGDTNNNAGKNSNQFLRLVRDGFSFSGFDSFGAVPDAPTIGTATAGNTQVTVTFTPPANDGGSSITSYAATCGAQTNSGTSSPIVVTGLTNGVAVTCSVTATNDNGTSVASADSNGVTPLAFVTLVGVQSRKTHGAAGTFDIPITTGIPIGGAVTVEPRSIGSGHQIVFQFDIPINAAGAAASVDTSSTPIGTASPMASGNDVVVTLTGIPDNRRVKVTLTNVNGAGGTFVATLGFLIGDGDNSRGVDAIDILGVRARSGQAAVATNFRFDFNASGTIDALDILAARARSGLQIQ